MQEESDKKNRREEKIRGEILDAAIKLFYLKEFNDISIHDISEMTILSRTTIYKYFHHGKEEIYFVLGTMGFATANKTIQEKILIEEKSGLDQFLGLCEFTFDVATPFIFTILRYFYNRMNIKKLNIENWFQEVAESYGTPKFFELREKISPGEPFLVDFYAQIQQTAFLWEKAIVKGLKDGTITNSLDKEQILHYVNLTITGIIEQTLLRKETTLDRIGLEKDTIRKNTLNLIKLFLEMT